MIRPWVLVTTNRDSAVRTPMSQMLRSSLSSLFLAQFQTVSLMSRMGTAQAAKMVRTFQHPVPPLPVSAIQSHHEVGCGIEVTLVGFRTLRT
ncbi:hypothetical protein HZ326_13150 [Fusarium oxysporum f. sp. albedinis]|nr:hypothetical protein HZ326_13150 [Fusarium oxysporum f. sp. albedinis]